MAEKEYIDKVAFNYAIREAVKKYPNSFYNGLEVARQIAHDFPAADVLPRDEAITMGAELAAMHGSDATSQQLEEAYLKGVEYGMTRRDVRPVVRGKWEEASDGDGKVCSVCGEDFCDMVLGCNVHEWNFCPNCGADMREES